MSFPLGEEVNHTLLTPLFVLTYVLTHQQLLWKTHGGKKTLFISENV